MEEAAKSRVFVADDQSVILVGLAHIIGSEPDLEVCGMAADAATAVRAICATHPAIVILEVGLPGAEQIDLIEVIRARDPQLRVLVFTAHDSFKYAERALRAGVNGYMSKQEDCAQLVVAIRRVLRGDTYISPQIIERVAQQGSESPRPLQTRYPDVLKDREAEVLKLLGQGYTTRHIAQYLHLSVKTVECYRAHLRRKLGLRNSRELIKYAADLERGNAKVMTAGTDSA